MWGRNRDTSAVDSSAEVDTLVGENTMVEGNIVFDGGLHVDGHIKGNVKTRQSGDSMLSLSEVGCIEGEVHVDNVVLNGTINGDVHALQKIELGPRARVTGNVYYKLIEMAMGAEVNGNLVHSPETDKQVVLLQEGKKGKSGSA